MRYQAFSEGEVIQGIIDLNEFLSSMPLMERRNLDAKIRCAFELYDFDSIDTSPNWRKLKTRKPRTTKSGESVHKIIVSENSFRTIFL